MEIKEFEDKLNEIRAKNGWVIHLELKGIWVVTIEDKETGKKLASTGMTSLTGLFYCLDKPKQLGF